MTEKGAIREACRIMALAFRSIDDDHPSDGFCEECPFHGASYRNDGRILDYMRVAVLEKLKRDGFKIADGFDPETGRERVYDAEATR